jgi:hypothetical protein
MHNKSYIEKAAGIQNNRKEMYLKDERVSANRLRNISPFLEKEKAQEVINKTKELHSKRIHANDSFLNGETQNENLNSSYARIKNSRERIPIYERYKNNADQGNYSYNRGYSQSERSGNIITGYTPDVNTSPMLKKREDKHQSSNEYGNFGPYISYQISYIFGYENISHTTIIYLLGQIARRNNKLLGFCWVNDSLECQNL